MATSISSHSTDQSWPSPASPSAAMANCMIRPKKTKSAKPKSSKGSKTKKNNGFAIEDYVVYPAHGVGKIIGIEDQEIAGMSLKLFIIEFEKEKMTLRVPIAKATATVTAS